MPSPIVAPQAELPKVDAKPMAPIEAPKAEAPKPTPAVEAAADHVAPSAPVVLDGYVLARWGGQGTFAGAFYTYPDVREMPRAKGPTLGYFDAASVKKMPGLFEVLSEMPKDNGPAPAKAIVQSADAPEGFVFARWTGAGKFSGMFYSFPERKEKPCAIGPTIGFFPMASVKKMPGLFEIL